MKTLKIYSLVLPISGLLFSSCFKKKDINPQAREIKYEVTGNFTGTLTIFETQKNSTYYRYYTSALLPWQKDTIFSDKEIIGIGASAQFPGSPGETITLKIYSGGKLVKDTMVMADNSGDIRTPPIFYLIP